MRQPVGTMNSLGIPVECAFRTQNMDDPPRVKCHQALICQRCGFCFAHCECGPAQIAPPVSKRLRRGEVDENQMILCDKPVLRTI